jgi:hypothetical protein
MKDNMTILSLLPKVRIHTWGGLGSQLYAVALANDLQKKFNYRRIKYISHTSGVTRREPALQFYSKDVREKNDYSGITQVRGNTKYRTNLPFLGKKILISAGIMAYCNDIKETDSLKPWILIIRGHYSNRQISFESATRILQRIDSEFISEMHDKDLENITLHYRLGDLEILPEKSPIETNQVKSILEMVLDKADTRTVHLHSDSILLAKSKLMNGSQEFNIVAKEISPLKTVHECVRSKLFIGTNSKISIWIAILRATKNSDQTSFLPEAIKHMLISQGSSFVTKSINFY